MPLLDKIPNVNKCCGCITDLKTAAAIIAVLGIVTSPAISWVVVRHAYVIRVTCVVTTNTSRPDVVDINLHNALSFGFGANAGLGPSCLSRVTTDDETKENKTKSQYVQFVRYSGWVVFLTDIAFLISSVNFLIKMFKGADKQAAQLFIYTGLLSILFTFMYGIMYVSACMYVGGGFPVFEFFFAMIDLIIWLYFIVVISSYYKITTPALSLRDQFFKFLTSAFLTVYGFFTILANICPFRFFSQYICLYHHDLSFLVPIFIFFIISCGTGCLNIIIMTFISTGRGFYR